MATINRLDHPLFELILDESKRAFKRLSTKRKRELKNKWTSLAFRKMLTSERTCTQSYLIAGVDEVGGPLAGPVVAAAVIPAGENCRFRFKR